MEDETGVEFAPRQNIGFDCPMGHHFDLTFSVEAELPAQWECPKCGQVAGRSDGVLPEPKEEKAVRSHWDMLRERRSIPELEELLTERLKEIREQ